MLINNDNKNETIQCTNKYIHLYSVFAMHFIECSTIGTLTQCIKQNKKVYSIGRWNSSRFTTRHHRILYRYWTFHFSVYFGTNRESGIDTFEFLRVVRKQCIKCCSLASIYYYLSFSNNCRRYDQTYCI